MCLAYVYKVAPRSKIPLIACNINTNFLTRITPRPKAFATIFPNTTGAKTSRVNTFTTC